MTKCKIDFSYDWKAIDKNAYVPFFVVLLLIGYSYLRMNAMTHILPALEFVFPVFAAWWSIFIFQDILEEPGSEITFSYPISRWQLGIYRVAIFFILYLIIMLMMLMMIDYLCTDNIFVPLFIQLGAESFFFAGLGFLSMTLTRNTGWSLTIVIVYTSIQILTKGQMFPLINIYLFNEKMLKISELWTSAAYTILLGSILWVSAQIILNKLQKFN